MSVSKLCVTGHQSEQVKLCVYIGSFISQM